MTRKKNLQSNIVIYQTKNGALELSIDRERETFWASQAHISDLFDIDQSVISRHIRNILKDGEISAKSNMQKMHIAYSDKPVVLYSLDVILAVGYRTSSAKAIKFRQWATSILRQHIVDGYTINKKRLETHYSQFLDAVASVKKLLPEGKDIDTASVLELVTFFADTWMSLDAYDKATFTTTKTSKKKVKITADMLSRDLEKLKHLLIEKGEATQIFGQLRKPENVESIIGNVMQSFGGRDMYPSVEEKAAHLLYFMIKDHPFVDGNKRSGAYGFVWFLQKAAVLDVRRITPPALTALTLLVAESEPKEKYKMIQLVMTMISPTMKKNRR